jgi:hypothetical protein
MLTSIALAGVAGEFEVGFDQAPALMKEVASRLVFVGIELIETLCIIYSGDTMTQATECLMKGGFDRMCTLRL